MSLCGNAWPAVKASSHVRPAWSVSVAMLRRWLGRFAKVKETDRYKFNFYDVHEKPCHGERRILRRAIFWMRKGWDNVVLEHNGKARQPSSEPTLNWLYVVVARVDIIRDSRRFQIGVCGMLYS